MATIYCANCEAACSDKAESCPKCGHRLARGVSSAETRQHRGKGPRVRRTWSERLERSEYFDIGVLWIIGTAAVWVSVVVSVLAVGFWNWEQFWGGIAGVMSGMFTRGFAGIWGTLVRIARK